MAESVAAVSQSAMPAIVLGAVTLVVTVGSYVWLAAALSRVFFRSGVDRWRAWVPVLNVAEILRLGRISPWLVVLLFVPLADLFGVCLLILAVHRVNRAFSRGAGMTVLAVFLPPVWASVLAWSRSTDVSPSFAPNSVAPDAVAKSPFDTRPTQAAVQGTQPPPVPPGGPSPSSGLAARSPRPAPAWEPPPLVTTPAYGRSPAADRWGTVQRPQWQPPEAQQPELRPWVPPEPQQPWTPGPPVTQQQWTSVAPDAQRPWAPKPLSPAATAVIVEPSDELDETAPRTAPPLSVPAEPPTDTGTVVIPRSAPLIERPDDDETIVVVRRRPRWHLTTDFGAAHELTGGRVVVGRRPEGDERGVQYLALEDDTKTLSKQHAFFLLDGDEWTVADLASTNGTVLVDEAGVEHPVDPGTPARVGARVLLGELGVVLKRVIG
ncbi:DUF5684 domain-containing protein [Humibacter ginsenosidimutans]|uniref:FHA domain-containing protein n=1 Tax=Humibacter ginsenosidimutans TaxID=2599293 RepID=A0A5B8M319_9MICO|nr:DUF5684 domain-containing protein [Humibacter ginsenosidimutans]QDZ14122.1 FHA domain-containing protein [Humibacter ginsenosidimutans]